MRYHEIINERISLTRYKKDIEDTVLESLLSAIQKSKINLSTIDKNILDRVYDYDDFTEKVRPILSYRVTKLFAAELTIGISALLKDVFGEKVNFKVDNINVAGGVYDTTIVLGFNQIKEQVDSFMDSVAGELSGEDYDWLELFLTKFTKMPRELLVDHFPKANIAITIVHELTHLVQKLRQLDAGRTSLEYRSYLGNRKQHDDAMQNILSGKHTPDDERLYYSSPQEIDAYAQEIAYNFIHNSELKYRDLNDLIKNLSTDIQDYIKDRFSDPSKPEEYKVFKRMYKRVYLEIQAYVERRIKKEKRANKKK